MPSKLLFSLLLLGAFAANACGGSSFSSEDGQSGGKGGSGGTGGSVGGSGGTGGSVGGSGGSGGSVGGTGGTGGSVGGSGGTGGSVGGSGGTGGSVGGGSGSGGSAASGGSGGVGGAAGAGGVGGAAGGGTGGSGAGAGGTAGTCGFCPRVACAPAIWITVQASAQSPGGITNLDVDVEGISLQCSPNGATPCQWSCQAYGQTLTQGDHSITISADGYEPQTIEFTVGDPPVCGCCGCGCQNYYQGTVMLEPNGEDPGSCCANTDVDPNNCGACGVVCEFGQCANGFCLMPQLSPRG